MCPSYEATREEEHSTRGRAHLLFEPLNGDELAEGWRDPHVKDALDLCMSCKGGKHDCPVDVDMARYKAEFLAHWYDKRFASGRRLFDGPADVRRTGDPARPRRGQRADPPPGHLQAGQARGRSAPRPGRAPLRPDHIRPRLVPPPRPTAPHRRSGAATARHLHLHPPRPPPNRHRCRGRETASEQERGTRAWDLLAPASGRFWWRRSRTT